MAALPLTSAELNCRIVMDMVYRPRETELLQLRAQKANGSYFRRGNVSRAGIRAI